MLVNRIEDTNVAIIETDHEIGTFFVKAVVSQLPSNYDRIFVFYVEDFNGSTHESVLFVPDREKIDQNHIMRRLQCNADWATMLIKVIKEMGLGSILKQEV